MPLFALRRNSHAKWTYDSTTFQEQEHAHTTPLAELQGRYDTSLRRERLKSKRKSIDELQEAKIAAS